MRRKSTSRDPWTIQPDEPVVRVRPCHATGCEEHGEFRAPRSRDDLTSYIWFCRDHVRAYNASWNYYAGMNEAQIEAQLRADTTWQRPTWPLGSRAARHRNEPPIHDEFGVYQQASGARGAHEADERKRREQERRRREVEAAESPAARALLLMELTPAATQAAIKSRYRELVKRHHPDANGGDKASEEQLKLITDAYRTLRNAFGF